MIRENVILNVNVSKSDLKILSNKYIFGLRTKPDVTSARSLNSCIYKLQQALQEHYFFAFHRLPEAFSPNLSIIIIICQFQELLTFKYFIYTL